MRSLWRRLAVQWLGGEGSEALAGDSAILDLIMARDRDASRAFDVQRAPGVSHRALTAPREPMLTVAQPGAETPPEEVLSPPSPDRNAR